MRALIIYIIAYDGVQDMERKRLIEASKINNTESQAITNLAHFSVQLSSGQPKAKYQKTFVSPHNERNDIHTGVVTKLQGNGQRIRNLRTRLGTTILVDIYR
jgi:hypothetical protein